MSLILWGVLAVLVGATITAYFEDIMKWAKNLFDDLAPIIRKAWVYVQRVPGAVKQFFRYIENKTMYEKTEKREVSPEELKRMRDNGDLSQEEYEILRSEYERKIGEFDRER